MTEHAKEADQLADLPRKLATDKTADVKGGAIVMVNGGGNTPQGTSVSDGTSNTIFYGERY